jgi:hypothetical protein
MDLQSKYRDNYILLAAFRQYIENGTMLASVNFWLDSAQNFKEFAAVNNRMSIVADNPVFQTNEFLLAFISEDFPRVDESIPEDILVISLKIIEDKEGKVTLELVKEFLLQYALIIAKSSKEDYLAFLGLDDSISDSEAIFINKLRNKFYTN